MSTHPDLQTGRKGNQGQRNPSSKITEAEALEILDRCDPRTETWADIAEDYPLSKFGVRNLVTGKTWRHLHE